MIALVAYAFVELWDELPRPAKIAAVCVLTIAGVALLAGCTPTEIPAERYAAVTR